MTKKEVRIRRYRCQRFINGKGYPDYHKFTGGEIFTIPNFEGQVLFYNVLTEDMYTIEEINELATTSEKYQVYVLVFPYTRFEDALIPGLVGEITVVREEGHYYPLYKDS
jgi:hypothetical protein